jgi:hypothetical protein
MQGLGYWQGDRRLIGPLLGVIVIGGAVLFLHPAPASAEQILYCTDTAGTGFTWFGNNQQGRQGKFVEERYTVKVLSESERMITRMVGDTAGVVERTTCHQPYPREKPEVVVCANESGTTPWVFHGITTYTRAFLFGPPAGGGDPNIWISYGVCTKF